MYIKDSRGPLSNTKTQRTPLSNISSLILNQKDQINMGSNSELLSNSDADTQQNTYVQTTHTRKSLKDITTLGVNLMNRFSTMNHNSNHKEDAQNHPLRSEGHIQQNHHVCQKKYEIHFSNHLHDTEGKKIL